MDKDNLKEIADLQSVNSNESVSDDSSFVQSLLSEGSSSGSDEESKKNSKPLQQEKQISYDTGKEYYSTSENSDTINIFVPEKYRENSKTCMTGMDNYLINFYVHLQVIRKLKLTFRDITLNHILILQIRHNGEVIRLYLNLGLNPFLYFNDYYISNLNCFYLSEPILVLKRFKKFDPYSDIILLPVNKTEMVVREKDIYDEDDLGTLIVYQDDLDHSDVLIIKNYDELNKKRIWNAQCSVFTTDYHMNKQTRHLNTLKQFVDIQKELNPLELDNVMECNSSIDISTTISDNISIWKYGTTTYHLDKKEFEWINTNGSRDYELVREFNKIRNSDFKNIMRTDKENFTEQELKGVNRLESLGYNEIVKKMINKMHVINDTSLCSEEENSTHITTSPLRLLINGYIIRAQEYIYEGNHIGLSKYVKKENIFCDFFENENMYQDLLNNSLFYVLEDGLEKYSNAVITNEDYELQVPDIYVLLGFHTFPCVFSKELWENYDFAHENKWFYLIKCTNWLGSTGWYYIYGLCCFFAQVIGPSYYVYNYYLVENNDYCPNNSTVINKFFALAYYLVLYARMNSFWNSLTTSVWQYGNTTIITNDNYLRLTLLVNSICLYIVPLFTYTLFIELNGVTDLILNCLTGEFLINIDNLIVEFIGEENYIKTLTKDLLIFSFLEKGFPRKNIMEGNTNELWLMTVFQVIQMFGTLLMTGVVYNCI